MEADPFARKGLLQHPHFLLPGPAGALLRAAVGGHLGPLDGPGARLAVEHPVVVPQPVDGGVGPVLLFAAHGAAAQGLGAEPERQTHAVLLRARAGAVAEETWDTHGGWAGRLLSGGGRGGGGLGPKKVPKMAQSNFPNGKVRCFPRSSHWFGGGGDPFWFLIILKPPWGGGGCFLRAAGPAGGGELAAGQLAPHQFSSILDEGSRSNGHNSEAQHSKQTKMLRWPLPFKSTVHKGYNVQIARRRARRRSGGPMGRIMVAPLHNPQRSVPTPLHDPPIRLQQPQPHAPQPLASTPVPTRVRLLLHDHAPARCPPRPCMGLWQGEERPIRQ